MEDSAAEVVEGEVVELWRCPEHDWTWEYHYSPHDPRPRCPADEGEGETCGKMLRGPYEAVVRGV